MSRTKNMYFPPRFRHFINTWEIFAKILVNTQCMVLETQLRYCRDTREKQQMRQTNDGKIREMLVPLLHVCTRDILCITICVQSYFFPLLAPFLDLFTGALVGLLFFATTGLAAAFFLEAGFFAGDALAFFFGEASAVLRGLGGPLFPFLGL